MKIPGNTMLPPTEIHIIQKDKAIDRGARRREKSRDAARTRRQLESDTYNEICKVIPIPNKQLAQMDRSTVMRLLISFMKLRNIINSADLVKQPEVKQEDLDVIPNDDEYINALNGFIIVLSHDCDLLYVSTNAKQYIGITSLDLIGQNLFGYTHEGDHGEITNCLKASSEETENCSFFMRMKSTLTSSGKNVNLKSATYKVLKCDGVVHHSTEPNDTYMVAYCEPIPHPTNIEMVLDHSTFLSRHSLDMKFTVCERVNDLLGYSEEDMIGKSFYDFCNTEDLKTIETLMKKLFRLGQVTTNHYRMLAKYGGYVWVISQATIINNPRNQQPSYVVCVHYVISDIINSGSIMSLSQLGFFESKVPKLVKQEAEDLSDDQLGPLDCTDEIFCDSTDSIFCSFAPDGNDDVNLGGDVNSHLDIPLEVMAQNAPSIGDEIDFSDINFSETFGVESIESLCNNAPSIGDPQFSVPSSQGDFGTLFPEVNVNIDNINGLKDNYPNRGFRGPQMSPQHTAVTSHSLTPSPPEDPKRKLPDMRFQLLTIPRSQYQQHMNFQPQKRRVDIDGSVYKANPPEFSPLAKRQKISQCFESYDPMPQDLPAPYKAQRNVPDATKLLLSGHTQRDKSSLMSLLLQPGNSCDNAYLDRSTDQRESCSDRDCSRPLGPTSKINTSSLLPVLSVHDCEVNAPINKNLSTMDWMTIASTLGI
uniref:hypoxia-inducible factor 1-alpha-like n=1 Tax=Styela clava TaxID=7725 RepID=UPI001939D9E1|nr:hypoxia-inducible factor 1-alpha-like [Styela clava]